MHMVEGEEGPACKVVSGMAGNENCLIKESKEQVGRIDVMSWGLFNCLYIIFPVLYRLFLPYWNTF